MPQRMRIVGSHKLLKIFIGVNLLFFMAILGYIFFQDAFELFLKKTSLHIVTGEGWGYLVHLFISLVILLTPLPATIVVLTNGYLLGISGFFVSYLAIIFASVVLYRIGLVSSRLGVFGFTFLRKYYRLFQRKIGHIGITSGVFISRFIVPFFFHNYCLGAMRYRLDRFLIMILVTEVPVTLFLTIGSSELSKLTFQSENLIGYFVSIGLVLGSLLIGKIVALFKKNEGV